VLSLSSLFGGEAEVVDLTLIFIVTLVFDVHRILDILIKGISVIPSLTSVMIRRLLVLAVTIASIAIGSLF